MLATMPGHRQAAVHTRILAALLEAGSTDEVREAVAQFERALRFSAGEPEAALAGRYAALADELSLIDSWEAAVAAYEHALALWRATGNRRQEGDVLRKLGSAFVRLCRAREYDEATEAAVRVLEPAGPSAELARAWATLAGQRLAKSRFAEAMALAQRGDPLRRVRSLRRPGLRAQPAGAGGRVARGGLGPAVAPGA